VVQTVVLLANLLFVILFFKELKISSFDPALASSTGFNANLMHYLLMTLVAITAVASFESVGNILVVAMFVVPAAAAYMLTDRLWVMIVISVVLAVISAVVGHIAALVVPSWFGYRSTTTASMMATTSGVIFLLAALFGPRHGVVVKLVRQRILSWRILSEDVIALLYRMEERTGSALATRRQLQEILMSGAASTSCVLAVQTWRGLLQMEHDGYRLTEFGKQRSRDLVRSHRLWEEYLVREAGVPTDRIHDKAERLEHFTTRDLQRRLNEATSTPDTDPHGAPIPPERPFMSEDQDVGL
jgi:manganese/zinc/iron transport system permease protein